MFEIKKDPTAAIAWAVQWVGDGKRVTVARVVAETPHDARVLAIGAVAALVGRADVLGEQYEVLCAGANTAEIPCEACGVPH